jgi:MipA family protein
VRRGGRIIESGKGQSVAQTILTASGAVLCGLLVASAAQAQTIPQAPAVDGLIPKGITVTVGVQGTYQPKYEGSKSSEFQVLPILKFDTGSGLGKRLDVRSLDDISFALLQSGPFQLGVLTGYRDGRDESDSPRLRGLGDIDGGLVVGGFARYNIGPAYLRGSYHRQIIEEDTGGLFKFVVGADYAISPKIMLHAFTGIEAGDHTFMQTYFGVNALQSARSGLAVYRPTGGAKSFHLGAGTDVEVLPTWTLTASAEYVRYLGNAENSPIVEEADQFKARLGLSKSFTLNLGN